MPKDWTPKKIAAAMKAKGLQRLRWYCQMCQKQCRDENGFKCHQTSESHLRQMRIFAENSSGMMQRFSEQFERVFMDVLSRQHGTKRVKANDVYREVIQDRHHVHMNSTHWATLTDFVLYLGKKGLIIVDDDPENGLHVQWIDRNPEKLAREEKWRQKQANLVGDAQMMERDFKRRQKALKRLRVSAEDADEGDTELKQDADAGPVRLQMGETARQRRKKKKKKKQQQRGIASGALGDGALGAFFQDESKEESEEAEAQVEGSDDTSRDFMSTEGIRFAQDASAPRMERVAPPRDDPLQRQGAAPWLAKGLKVRILDRAVGDGVFLNTVGRVSAVEEDGFVALVKVKTQEGRSLKLRIDESNLEAVSSADAAVGTEPIGTSRERPRGHRGDEA